ncbi:pentatricopeptide repeat-containing protein At5g62370 isoform X1 [Rhodamnia argentea]|uniref:Pentatricopeptide repeat-containing protein At5g62370 isoform X1 n=1 Tax=Rhodamnia argentea TaxID=178133 RepID=A0A8B8QQQ6_9MYRT|nr:pentatricopeptide repeat-containing protein At5g62370 isoform X1 [Rhodamnia argentea]
MLKKCITAHHRFFSSRRAITTCALHLEPPASATSGNSSDHKSLSLSLLEQLVGRGQFSAAQSVVRRIIVCSSSALDAVSAVHFLASRGLGLDSGSHGVLLRKLVQCGEYQLAEAWYNENIVGRGIDPDYCMLDSMINCFCKLGKLDEAKREFDRCVESGALPNVEACDAIFRELCAGGMALEAFGFFVRLIGAGVSMRIGCYNQLIDSLCFKGHMDEAVKVFYLQEEITELPPTLHQYKSLFYGLCKGGRIVEAEQLSIEMEAQGFFVDKVMYNWLIFGYSKDRKMKMAVRIFFRMLKMGCEVDGYTFNTLIHGFMKRGIFDKGWTIYKQMVDCGVQPTVVTYQIMISNYCRIGKVDCALELLNEMLVCDITPSVHSYTTLVASLYKKNKLTEADELCKRMLENGVLPDPIFFLVVIRMHPRGGELQIAYMMLQAIGHSVNLASNTWDGSMDFGQKIDYLLEGIARKDLNLASSAFTICISALCETGDIDAAILLVDKADIVGCHLLLFTYNSLIKCLCRKGLFEEAESLIRLIQDRGIVPDLETYLIMINGYCKQGNLQSAYRVMGQISERGLKPNVAMYDCIIGFLSTEKRIYEAEDLFIRMLEDGVDPDETIYMTMINAYARSGRLLEASELFDKMIENFIKPSSYSYTALINGLLKRNMTEEGCMYLDKMIGDGYEPNNVLYTSLIGHYLREGEFKFAFMLVDLMYRNQMKFDLITHIVVLRGVCKHVNGIKNEWRITRRASYRARKMLFDLLQSRSLATHDRNLKVPVNMPEAMKHFALNLFKKIKDSEFMPNLFLYNGLISGFCRANMIEDAYHHVELMQREGLHPNQVTYTILIGGHITRGEIDSAVGLFNKMNADGYLPDGPAYNRLLRGLCSCGRLLDALSLVYAMQKRGLFLSKLSYTCLLNHLCSSRLDIHAFKIFEEMLSHDLIPSLRCSNLLLSNLCVSRRWHEAQVVHHLMHKEEYVSGQLNEKVFG